MPLSDLWMAMDEHQKTDDSDNDSSDGDSSCWSQLSDHDDEDGDDDHVANEPNPPEDVAGNLKKRMQTEKARTASLLAKQARKMEKHAMPNQTAAELFQETCFTSEWKHNFDSTAKSHRLQSRAVCSYLFAMVAAINSALDQSSAQIEYMMTTNVVDDVSLVVSTNEAADMTNTVRTVMHNYQQVILASRTTGSAGDCIHHKNFLLHQPSIYLNSAKYKDMCAGMLVALKHAF
jgi:uncharacterized protein GlcG (DUF336 family)